MTDNDLERNRARSGDGAEQGRSAASGQADSASHDDADDAAAAIINSRDSNRDRC